LLALYEAKINMLDNSKTRGKIWLEIATGLEEYGIQVFIYKTYLKHMIFTLD